MVNYKVVNNLRPSELEAELNRLAGEGYRLVFVQKMEKYVPVNQKTEYYTMCILEKS